MSVIIGIDLGSTNSLVSYWDGSKAVIIPNAIGERITPSVVGIDANGDVLVGTAAKERMITHPQLTAARFKRYMGSQKTYQLGNHTFQPEDLSSFLLRSLKADAEAYLQQPVDEAVISVPAYFSDRQRKTTQAAGELAGLKVERLINEPTAAAISFGLHTNSDECSFLVFDLGGGTFDVSVLSLFDGIMEVNATAGHTALGGEDFVDVMINAFLKAKDLSTDQLDLKSQSRLRWRMEKLKRELTNKPQANITISLNETDLSWTLSRNELEKMAANLIDRMRQPIERSLNDASITPSELSAVLLVGGATRMPLVRSLVSRMFGKFPTSHHNPDEVVALGTAIQAGLKSRDKALAEVVLTDVCPYSLGLDTAVQHVNGKRESGYYHPIIERNTAVPVSREETFRTCWDDQEKLLIDIYQGESRYTKNNIRLGQLEISVPPSPAGEQPIKVRYTYDINGMLEVQVHVLSTDEISSVVIEENPGHLSKLEIAKRLKALEKIKIHPREQMPNRTLVARAERLYEQTLGKVRQSIAESLLRFNAVINQQNPHDITEACQQLSAQLDYIEAKRI